MPFSRRLIAALAVLMVLFTLASRPNQTSAASCSGNSHALTLSGGGADPGSGTTATRFKFSVTYSDNNGCTPDRIVIVVVGLGTYGLSYVEGGLQSGATFARTMTLPPGRWAYRFEATSGSGAGERQATLTKVTPAKVTVAAPTPAPTVAPTKKPLATPVPTPRPSAAPTKPPPSPRASPRVSPRASATPTATSSAAAPVATAETAAPTLKPSPAPVISASITRPDAGPPIAMLKLLVSSVGTVGGLVLFAFLSRRLLRPAPAVELPPPPRRRRDDPQPDAEPGP